LDGLVALLDPDVVLRSDGGGAVRSALRPIRGARKVARFLLGVRSRFGAGLELRVAPVNGRPELVGRRAGRTEGVYAFAVSGGRISGIHVVLNPRKLKWADGAGGTGGVRSSADRTSTSTPIPGSNSPREAEELP
ncbi:hypothetical protein ACFQZU_22365, partial [Streptomonospora algeriensis]